MPNEVLPLTWPNSGINEIQVQLEHTKNGGEPFSKPGSLTQLQIHAWLKEEPPYKPDPFDVGIFGRKLLELPRKLPTLKCSVL